jgi:cobyric acid synthase
MKVLKSIGLACGVIVLCAGFGLLGSFLSDPSSVHAAPKPAAAASDAKPMSQNVSVAVQTAQEATDMAQ